MKQVTAAELAGRCPMVWIECLGKRILARTSSCNDQALLTITDTQLLSRIEGDGTFVVSWREVADAMNNAVPIYVVCKEKEQ